MKPNIIDAVESYSTLTDANGGPSRLTGTAKRANSINANRRYYSQQTLIEATAAAQEKIVAGALIGLLDHPDWNGASASRLAIKYTRLWMDGLEMRFEGELVRTAAGQDLAAALEANVQLGISTRGTGSMRYLPAKEIDTAYPYPEELIEVISDFRLRSIDVVLEPADAAGRLAAADAKEEPMEKDKPTEETANALAEKKALEDALARAQAELSAMKAAQLEAQRKALAARMLAEATLPRLEAVGGIDLHARFEAQLEAAALAADSDHAAQQAVSALIDERRALMHASGVKLPVGNNERKEPQNAKTVAGVRGLLGL